MVNLGLVQDAVLSGSVTDVRGSLGEILYDPVTDDYKTRTDWNEYGERFGVNLGPVNADNGFEWRVDWTNPKYINYITFGGSYQNQRQELTMWRISYLKDGAWNIVDEGQGGWIDNETGNDNDTTSSIFEWGGPDQIPVIADALRVQLYSDGTNDLRSIHLRGRGGISNNINDADATPKATLIQYLPLDSSCGLSINTGDYLYCNDTWKDSNEPNETTFTRDVYIGNGTYVVEEDQTIEVNNLEVSVGAKIVIEQGGSIKVHGDLINNGAVESLSTSTKYSSLIVNGTSTGLITYKRHINAFSENDLVSSPLKGNTFGYFASTNPNIFENPSNSDQKLFGPFNEVIGEYEIYSVSEDSFESLILGRGYRAARDASEDASYGTTFTFRGAIETGEVTVPITASGAPFDGWNLLGNPYPSYLDFSAFFTLNQAQFASDAYQAVYGYDGDASNGWTILNNLSITDLIAPGQGFFIKSKPGGGVVTFDSSMQMSGNSDDFILGRNSQDSSSTTFVKLEISTSNESYSTRVYLNPNCSLGLDAGYDAAIFNGQAPDFGIYTHLVNENENVPLAIQAISMEDVNYNTQIPMGVSSNANEDLVFSLAESTMPDYINVYLEDSESNTITLLNEGDYSLTTTSALNGVGRFFIRLENSALSSYTPSLLEALNIYNNNITKEIIIDGQLLDKTSLKIFDLKGSLLLETDLNPNVSTNSVKVDGFAQGIYIIRISSNLGDKQIKKLVIR
jgi:hypothetical protein